LIAEFSIFHIDLLQVFFDALEKKGISIHSTTVVLVEKSEKIERKMNLMKPFLVVILISVVSCNQFLVEKNSNFKNVARLVQNVIEGAKSDKGEMKDVVLLQLGRYKQTRGNVSEISNEIASAVQKENLVTMPNPAEVSSSKTMKKGDFIIIITDLYETVSEKLLKSVSKLVVLR
jgi:hypothetical protein